MKEKKSEKGGIIQGERCPASTCQVADMSLWIMKNNCLMIN